MSEQFIRLGSIVVDKATGKALRVVGRSHKSAGEHNRIDVCDRRQWGVTVDSTVYRCVYLPTGSDDDNAYPPSKPYDFPEEQLFRYHCENALPEDARRIHTQILTGFLADILEAAQDDEADRLVDAIGGAVIAANPPAEIPGEVLFEEARELADVALTVGGEPDE